MIKQQQQKQHHRTKAKNKIQQHCFSSGLLLCLKRKSLQRAIPALTSDSASQTTHQFPIVHTQLEPRYHSSGDEKQERETVTTLKIPGSEELEGWVLGWRWFSCHFSRMCARSGSRRAVWAMSRHPSPLLRVREDLFFARKPGKALIPLLAAPSSASDWCKGGPCGLRGT